MGKTGRRFAREYFWFALTLIAVLLGSAARAGALDEPASGNKKPTTEELEQRIAILEQKLEAQQQAIAALLQAQRQPALAQRAEAAQAAPAAPLGEITAAQPPPAQTTPLAAQAAAPQAIAPVAQTTTPATHPVTVQQAGSATQSNPQIFAGPGGFSFQSPDGANQIRFHGEFDFDGRFYNDNLTPDGSRSTWLLRRARPIIEGTFANIFDFRFNPDFAGGKSVIQDAFVAARFNPMFVVTAGKFKEPFGLERLQLSPNNRFIELGLPSDLVPNRDLGLQVSGTFEFPTGTLTYQVGYFDGVTDGTSTDSNSTPDVDNNDKKDWVARLFAQPFLRTDSVFRYLGAGIAVSYANQVGSAANTLLPAYKTETQRNFFSYDAATTAAGATIANGERLRISPQAYYYYKSFGLLAEYVSESQDVSRTFGTGANALTRRARLKPDSWQLGATFLVTGDDATFGTVIPKRPFAPDDPGWGALEFAARVSQLKLDSAMFFTPARTAADWFADPSAQARQATAWTLGLNWYLTQNVAWNLDYSKTNFDGGAPDGKDRADESAIFTRFQVAF
ncbi:MAG: OprO/OprP family phosphate-selective porin [Pseudomonadota bacterium]|nr:OprO/OprP family phosphate-selective porin [Pseudomonadota bacterium]